MAKKKDLEAWLKALAKDIDEIQKVLCLGPYNRNSDG